ncbi:HAD family hydrolase [Paucibacter sp. KCTC 42545]|uniref:HAD family hydrolase n=1 Tax=Paucibacter sp. KCTC 42545 TaxID=1768242 RepID=UPI000733B011|nr:HAD family phosphatase [Paucibacter sp. KCTC 42545]ALT78270.1 haloacid dehalogenase [Paucibacter sp. KCTC 42545]
MNIVFDFGGVLFRWHPATFLARVWPHRAADAEQAAAVAAEFFQNYSGDWGAFDQGLIDAPTVIERIAARTGWPAAEVAQVVAAVPDELQVLPQTVALIEELKRAGHRLFYLSNMPEPYADHLERHYPLHDWFEAGVFSGRVKLSKPMPEIFALASQRFGVAPQSCLFLDDHPVNIEAAKALGWQALLFTTADAVRPQLGQLML